MKSLLFAVTISTLFLVSIAGTQDAFANPGHSAFGKNPSAGGTCVGCQMGINVGVASAEANGVRGTCITIAEDPDGDILFPGTTTGLTTGCTAGFVGADAQYTLVDSANLPALSPVCAYWNAGTTGHVTLTMGPAAGSAVSALVGSTQAFECSKAPTGSNPPDFTGTGIDGTPVFVNIATGVQGIPNANIHNRYLVIAPGCDDLNNNGICESTDQDGNVFESYFVSQPMAGEVLPTSSTALFLAGASANAMVVLASLAAVAGVSFTILRLQATGRNL